MDWKDTLAKVAPTVAGALGGPLAGMAINVACEALGLSESTEDALQNAVAGGSPETLVKLKEANTQLKLELRKLDIKEEEIHQQDRDSARNLGIAKGVVVHARLSTAFVVGYFLIFSAVLFAVFHGVTIEDAMLALISALLGIMTAAVQQIMNFWFGSSSGSKQKTLQLGETLR